MPMTAAERQKKYREKLKTQNPDKYEEIRKKHLEKVKEKQRKMSKNLNECEKTALRQKWKAANNKRRQKQKQIETLHTEEDKRQQRGKYLTTKHALRLKAQNTKLWQENKNHKDKISPMMKTTVVLRKLLYRSYELIELLKTHHQKCDRGLVCKRPMKGLKKVDTNLLNLKDDSNRIQKEIKQTNESIAERIAPSNKKIEDEFDSFGKYIASSLRSMPQEFSIIAKTELQKTISDIQLKIVRQMNTGTDHVNRSQSSCGSASTFNRSQSPCGSASTSSDDENQRIECLSPTSDSCISTIKIEYDDDE